MSSDEQRGDGCAATDEFNDGPDDDPCHARFLTHLVSPEAVLVLLSACIHPLAVALRPVVLAASISVACVLPAPPSQPLAHAKENSTLLSRPGLSRRLEDNCPGHLAHSRTLCIRVTYWKGNYELPRRIRAIENAHAMLAAHPVKYVLGLILRPLRHSNGTS